MNGVRLGLTGVIGAGKSTALSFFSKRGWRTIATDEIARSELDQPEVRSALRKRWGGAVFHADGTVNRRAVAGRVFGDAAELDWLESLLHPRVRKKWEDLVAEDAGMDVVVEIPLLFEKNLASRFDFVVCVVCPDPLQTERLVGRGLSAEDIEARKNRQWSAEEKIKQADFVISNSGTIAFLEQQVIRLSRRLRGGIPPRI